MSPPTQIATNPGYFPEFDTNSETWTLWETRLANHLNYHMISDSDRRKCALIAYMGADAFRKINDKVFPDRKIDDLSYEEIVSTLKSVFEPHLNKWSARGRFRELRQEAGESLLGFEGRLRKSSIECVWDQRNLQENLSEQFIRGLADVRAKQFVLMKSEKMEKFSEIFDLADSFFKVQKATAASTDPKNSGINKLSSRSKQHHSNRFHPQNQGSSGSKPRNSTQNRANLDCYRCGDRNHLAPACQYKSVTCNNCGLVGHLTRACRKPRQSQHFIEEIPFHHVNSKNPIYVTVSLNGHQVDMEVDTGSGISTMTLDQFRSIAPDHRLHENDISLKSATGENFEPHSYSDIEVSYGNVTKNLRLYVFNKPNFPTLIGRDWLRNIPMDWTALLKNGSVYNCKEILPNTLAEVVGTHTCINLGEESGIDVLPSIPFIISPLVSLLKPEKM
ncbi:uncharacterized protein LOC108863982 [Galendromus occidentalis]|uniref:Uncharacterized protein LOC108863982 n=1 Tax=Galendromus occidentalis TaxID=34638 RepID=A0AAJ7L398_9ACAR|nr:uncharacterized protein LOC108863982 [Galendromus occidentalis]